MFKKAFANKRVILALAIPALFSLVALAGAIESFTFRPARPLARGELDGAGLPFASALGDIASIPLGRQIAFWVMLLLFGALAFSLLSPEMRKALLKQLSRAALGFLALYYWLKMKPELFAELLADPAPAVGAETEALSQTDAILPPVFEPPQVSGWLSFFVTLAFLLLAAVIFWRLNLWWRARQQAAEATYPLKEIARAVRASLLGLSADGSARDKIIQCYAEMSRAVDERRGLYRERAMTPAEFAMRLENAGMPREPVSRLTRLFESARYGAQTSDQGDVNEAIACLNSILKFCGEPS